MSLAAKKNIHHTSVLNSNGSQPWRHKFGFEKRQFISGTFFHTPIPTLSMQLHISLAFSQVDHETYTEVSCPTPINDAECKARLLCTGRSFKGKQSDS